MEFLIIINHFRPMAVRGLLLLLCVALGEAVRSSYVRGFFHFRNRSPSDFTDDRQSVMDTIADGIRLKNRDSLQMGWTATASAIYSSGSRVDFYLVAPVDRITGDNITVGSLPSRFEAMVLNTTAWPHGPATVAFATPPYVYQCGTCTRVDVTADITPICRAPLADLYRGTPYAVARPTIAVPLLQTALESWSKQAPQTVTASCRDAILRMACAINHPPCVEGVNMLPCRTQCDALEGLCGRNLVQRLENEAPYYAPLIKPWLTCSDSTRYDQADTTDGTRCIDVFHAEWYRGVSDTLCNPEIAVYGKTQGTVAAQPQLHSGKVENLADTEPEALLPPYLPSDHQGWVGIMSLEGTGTVGGDLAAVFTLTTPDGSASRVPSSLFFPPSQCKVFESLPNPPFLSINEGCLFPPGSGGITTFNASTPLFPVADGVPVNPVAPVASKTPTAAPVPVAPSVPTRTTTAVPAPVATATPKPVTRTSTPPAASPTTQTPTPAAARRRSAEVSGGATRQGFSRRTYSVVHLPSGEGAVSSVVVTALLQAAGTGSVTSPHSITVRVRLNASQMSKSFLEPAAVANAAVSELSTAGQGRTAELMRDALSNAFGPRVTIIRNAVPGTRFEPLNMRERSENGWWTVGWVVVAVLMVCPLVVLLFGTLIWFACLRKREGVEMVPVMLAMADTDHHGLDNMEVIPPPGPEETFKDLVEYD